MRQHARTIAGAALIAGVSADTLLRGGMLRIGFALWVATMICAVFVIDLQSPQSGGRGQRSLLLAGIACAAFGLVWRDAELLYVIDFLSLLCVGALTVWLGTGASLRQLTAVETVRAAALAVVNTVGGAAGVVRDASDHLSRTPELASKRRAISLGIAMAVPPLFLVLSLLANADGVFQRLMSMAADTISRLGTEHLFVSLVFAWLAAGWLRAAVGDHALEPIPRVRAPRLSFLTVSISLYGLVALLMLFLATQASMMFGGAQFLLRTAGLTAATYAREGFFQVIAAAMVVLATLVATEWSLSPDDQHGRRHFRTAGAILLSLVTVVLASAVSKLSLYINVYGMTVDRFFAFALMTWILGALLVFATTTLRARAEHFAPATLMLTVGWVAFLNIVNPEAIVVHTNARRAATGKSFDATYHATLSADALPALRDVAPRLDMINCRALSDSLRGSWGVRLAQTHAPGVDWRSRDLPLMRAAAWYAKGASIPCAGVSAGR